MSDQFYLSTSPSLLWNDVIHVRTSTDSNGSLVLDVTYIHKQEDNVWRQQQLHLQAEMETQQMARQWLQQIDSIMQGGKGRCSR